MKQLRTICLATCGVASAALGAAGTIAPAVAQTLRPVITSDGPLPPLRDRSTKRVDPQGPLEPELPPTGPALPPIPRNDADDQVDIDLDPQSAVGRAGGSEAQRAGGRRPAGDAQTTTAGDTGEAEAPAIPTGLRPALRDGETTLGDIQGPVDGAATEEQHYVNPDGADPLAWDARTGDDADAFERPPAGYDPSLYVTELEPLRPLYTSMLYRFEPWAPRGIRVGSFIFLPTADIGAAGVTNVFRSKPSQGDIAGEFRPGFVLRSDWRAHALEVRATGNFSFLDNYPTQNDHGWNIEARNRFDITRFAQINTDISHDVSQAVQGTLQSRLAGIGTSGSRPDITTDTYGIDVTQRFNRLTIDVRATSQVRAYGETTFAGALVTNRNLDLTANEQTARATWEFKPTLQIYGEGAINQRTFEAPSPIDGLSRNSTGDRLRLGVGFGNTSPILRGEASIGFGEQTPDDRRLAPIRGVIIDANAAWRADGLNSVLLRANTDVLETASAGSAGGFLRHAGIEWRHAFLRPLIGTAAVNYTNTEYHGIVLSETLAEYALGLEYYFAPEAMMYMRLAHSTYRISSDIGNWDGDEIRVGVRLRQ